MSALKTHFAREFFVKDEKEIRDFANSIGDKNPLHHDNEAAKKAGLLAIIAPGVRVTGFVSAALADEIKGVMVRRLDIEFLSPLYAGSFLSILCTVLNQKKQLVKVAISIKNGFEVLAEGSCLLVLPREYA